MWFNTVLLVVLWVAFCASGLLGRPLVLEDLYAQLVLDGIALLGGLYLLFLHYVAVEPTALVQRRWLGLGNRTVPFDSIIKVTERNARNWYGATIRTYAIKTNHTELTLTSAIYWPRDLRRLMQLLRDHGVPMSASVVHHLKLDGPPPLRWWQ